MPRGCALLLASLLLAAALSATLGLGSPVSAGWDKRTPSRVPFLAKESKPSEPDSGEGRALRQEQKQPSVLILGRGAEVWGRERVPRHLGLSMEGPGAESKPEGAGQRPEISPGRLPQGFLARHLSQYKKWLWDTKIWTGLNLR